MKDKYICVCGKQFDNAQSFNGHKSGCMYHYLERDGNLTKYNEKLNKICISNKNYYEKESNTLNKLKIEEKQKKLEKWVSEQHRCEKCGKIMTEYYGSGRFCSRFCANSHIQTDEINEKRSKTLIKNKNINIVLSDNDINTIYINNIKKRKNRQKRVKYQGNILPNIKKENLELGYQKRNRIPYSEQFWKKVLDNNNINYYCNVPVWKPGNNNYWLDFLIDSNIDLEIDGELHNKPDVMKKDNIRNQYLISQGYLVYRIKWVNPVSDKAKIIVNQQIDDLLKFLNKQRIS